MDDMISSPKALNKEAFKKHSDSRTPESPRVAARDRHLPRSGHRSEPKKGGFGKGAWGRPGDEEELDEHGNPIDGSY